MLVKITSDRLNYTILFLGALFLVIASSIVSYADSELVKNELISSSGIFFVQSQSSTIPQPGIADSTSSRNATGASQNTLDIEGSSSSERDETQNNTSSVSQNEPNDSTSNPNTVICEGTALCVMGEVVKVVNGKTFYVNIEGKMYKVELALINLPVQYEQAMRALTIFTRNTCLGSTVLIDQDDGQKENSFIAQVYCSPTKNLNSLLLDTGYVQLDTSQCQSSEFSKLSWAKSHGC